MTCGAIDRDCIEKAIRNELQRVADEGFVKAEERIVREMNAAKTDDRSDRYTDQMLDRSEVSYLVRASGATSGTGRVHKLVVTGVMNALDRNGDGRISPAEFKVRPNQPPPEDR